MKKPLTVTIALICTLILSGCSASTSAKKPTRNHYDRQRTAAELKHDRIVEGINLENFDKINVGDITDGTNGSSDQQVRQLFGNPSHIGTVSVNGISQKVTQFTWKDVSSTFHVAKVTVQFLNHKVVGKSYSPAAKQKQRVIAKSKIDQLGLGTTYQETVNALGVPNGESFTGQGPLSSKYLLYVTDSDGTAYDLTFTDDKLNNKFKTSIY